MRAEADLAYLTSANAEALLSFSMSRYRERGYEKPIVQMTMIGGSAPESEG